MVRKASSVQLANKFVCLNCGTMYDVFDHFDKTNKHGVFEFCCKTIGCNTRLEVRYTTVVMTQTVCERRLHY